MKNVIDIQGVRLAYWVEGEGRPVVLMHGWLNTHADVQMIADALKEHFRVYNLDLPGFGESTEPTSVWGIEEHERLLEEFVNTQLDQAPILIGHSHGGRIAIQYAANHDVRKLVLIDAAGVKPKHGLSYTIKVAIAKIAKTIVPLVFGKTRGQQWLQNHRRGSADYRNSSPLMREIMKRLVNTDLTPIMPRINCPTLLIWGEADTATPISQARTIEQLIPNAGLVSFPGCGHHSYLEQPARTVAVLNSFLEKDK